MLTSDFSDAAFAAHFPIPHQYVNNGRERVDRAYRKDLKSLSSSMFSSRVFEDNEYNRLEYI